MKNIINNIYLYIYINRDFTFNKFKEIPDSIGSLENLDTLYVNILSKKKKKFFFFFFLNFIIFI